MANEIFCGIVKFMEMVRMMVFVVDEVRSGFHPCEGRVSRQRFVDALFCYNC